MTRYNNDGGVVTHVINLANELVKLHHNVYVMAPLLEGKASRYCNLNCIFIPTDFDSKNFAKVFAKIRETIFTHRIDIIHSHNRNTSIYAEFIYKLYKIPFVWTLHQNNIPASFVYRKLTFPGLRTIVVSSELRNYCIEHFSISDERINTIFNGVQEDNYKITSEEEKIQLKKKFELNDPTRKIICLLSRLEPRKGHEFLLNSLKLIKSRNFYVLITGNDLDDGTYRKKLEKTVINYNLSDVVRFVGYVNPVEVFSISDAFVLPSRNEGQPIATIEAFLMKCLTIRTKSGGFEDMKELCLGIDYGDIKALSEMIEDVLTCPEKYKELVNRAQSFAQKECTCSAMARKTVGVYEQVLEG